MKCKGCGKDVTRYTVVIEEGVAVERCRPCMSGVNPSMYSTEKRCIRVPGGKDVWISPAHVRDIKARRISREDGRSVYRSYK